jgi:hypothetical protein
MPGRQRVERAPPEGGSEQEENQQTPRVLAGERVRESVQGPVRRHVAGESRRRRHEPRAGPHLERGPALARRTGEQVLGVGPQPVGGIGGRDAGGDVRPVAGEDLNRVPADAIGEGAVRELDAARSRGEAGRERDLDPGQGKPALAGREAELGAPRRTERQRASVRPQLQSRGDLLEQALEYPPLLEGARDLPVAVGVVALELLKGGDLGLVEDVVDPHIRATDANLGELVDGEVAERMG